MSVLQFGIAACSYPRGPHVDWQTGVTLRRRPEQDGANVGPTGKEPRPWTIMAVIFGSNVAQIQNMMARWKSEKGNVRTLYTTEPVGMHGDGVSLLSVDPVTGIRRMINATNGANYMQWINLVFARVAETTPTV